MAARSTRSMTENHITHIVSVCADPIPGEAPTSGISHMRIPVEDVDYADLLIHLPSACQFIDQALRSVRSLRSRHLTKRGSCYCIL
jgi:dual specificity phosphatase 12